MHEPPNISHCHGGTSQTLKDTFISKERNRSGSSLKENPEEELTITEVEVHSKGLSSYCATKNSRVQYTHSSASDNSTCSEGSVHEFTFTEYQFEDPDHHSEAVSMRSSEIEREVIRINEEDENSNGEYNSQRITQQAFLHMGGGLTSTYGHFMQPHNVRNCFTNLTVHSGLPGYLNIPLVTRKKDVELCSTEVLVSKSSVESLSEPGLNENRLKKTNHTSENFEDKDDENTDSTTCQKGFTELVKTGSSEVSTMSRSEQCHWQHFDPNPLSSGIECRAFCDFHSFVSPSSSITAATSHCGIHPEHTDKISSKYPIFGDATVRTSELDDSFLPPSTDSQGSSLNSSKLNLRLQGINQESDGCSSS